MTTHVEQVEWHRCYDDSWKGFIVPEAFTHPAKFARGLITRIYTHMLAEGMLKRGDSVVDPFGGIGTGGIIAASYGLSWYGCELESKFHALAQQNFAMHMHTWMQFDDQAPVLVCGDSRKLRVNLAGVLPQAVVASPPFTGGTDTQGRGEKLLVDASAKHRHKTRLIQGSAKEYGNTPGQLDGLPAGDVNAVISSPPYEGSFSGGDKVESADLEHDMRRRGCSEASIKKSIGNGHTGRLGYGVSSGQLGNATGETFWHAARDIVAECYAILKPGGWSAWVCKDFVRNKARVPFCDDWCKLLESQGFVVTTRVHAILVKETREADLFGGDDHVQKTERKSFFRRLAEKKGSPRIDWEEVIFARKQCDAAEHGAFAQISDGVSKPGHTS